MKVLVVDDEPPARARLRGLVGELSGVDAVLEAANGLDALGLVQSERPDVVLLDIRMPGMDGLEAARHLARMEAPPAVIFTTAYDAHALAAFEAQALDYLLKPIRRNRLEAALARAARLSRRQVNSLVGPGRGEVRTHLSATMHGSLRLVPVDEVRYLRAEHKYVVVGYPAGQVLVDDSLAVLAEELGRRFLRVHRNALVAVEHVRRLERGATGRQQIVLDGVDERIEISRRLAGAVRKRLRGEG